MTQPSEKTPLVPEVLPARSDAPQDGPTLTAVDPAKTRLRKLHSAPIHRFISTGMDMDSLRFSYAAKLVLAAVERTNVESAVDLLVLKGGFVNPLAYPLYYRTFLVCVILGHLALALWEGGMSPFPLDPAVAALEAFAFICYTGHVLLNLWTFGIKQYRDKKWHFAFTVLSVCHFLLLASALLAARYRGGSRRDIDASDGWWNAPRMALLAAHALRPMMLISNLQTIRRVFTNVLRTASRTGSILALGAVALAFYSVLGINCFNSKQVTGYTADGDNFDNFGSALLSMFVLITEENFPMVADPSFSQRPLVAFPFFVSFLLLFLVVILPLLLGIVLDAYAHQHAQQHDLSRRKARNALLAAYYVLHEDGSLGLSREQLVAVLTAEAGVGINRGQAEQMWNVLVPEDHGDSRGGCGVGDDRRRGRAKYIRSVSAPLRINEDDQGNGWAGDLSPSAANEARAERPRASSLRQAPGGSSGSGGGYDGRCRVDVHGFLRLADLLHQKVVEWEEEQEEEEIEEENAGAGSSSGGSSSTRRCILAGYEDTQWGAAWWSRERVRQSPEQEDLGDDGSPVGSGHGATAGIDGFGSGAGPPDDRESGGNGGGGGGVGGRTDSVVLDVAGVSTVGDNGVGRRWFTRSASRVLERARVAARAVVGRAWFVVVSQAVTLALVATALVWTPLSQDRYDRCLQRREGDVLDATICRREGVFRQVEGLVLLAFLAEMTAKALAVGCRRLWDLHWAHRFDLVILAVSVAAYAVVGIPGNKNAPHVDSHPALSDLIDLPRAMVVLRVVTVFPQLRRLLETMSTVAGMLFKIMVLYSCVSYSFAAVGMAIFGDAKSDILEPRYSFTTLPEACLALFFLTVTNNWNDLLYPLVNSVGVGRWSALYFVAYMLFCATMMLDVLVGVVIEGFRVSTKGPQQAEAVTAVVSPNVARDDDEDSFSDGSGPCISGGLAPGAPRDLGSSRTRGLSRKPIQRQYSQVKAEDMFRSDLKDVQGQLDEQDMRELDESVKAVEARLHQAWVSHVRRTGFVGDLV